MCTRSCKVWEDAWPVEGAVFVCPSTGDGKCRNHQGRVAVRPVNTVGTGAWATVTAHPF